MNGTLHDSGGPALVVDAAAGDGVTVVIPTYNEAEGIGALLAAVRAVLPAARLLVDRKSVV